jgi:hypothetical protein
MVTSLRDSLIKIVDGYSYLTTAYGEYEDAIEFSPWSGDELPNAFMWELQHKLYEVLSKNEEEYAELDKLDGFLTSKFNPNSVPEELKFLLSDKNWFVEQIEKNRSEHIGNSAFCGGFSAFLDSCYGMVTLPEITNVPITFCPFCGAELPPEFHTDEWWRKRGL